MQDHRNPIVSQSLRDMIPSDFVLCTIPSRASTFDGVTVSCLISHIAEVLLGVMIHYSYSYT